MKKIDILKEIKGLFGDKYAVVSYVGSKKPVILSCHIHGEFKLRIDHIREKFGKELCPHCASEKERHEKFVGFKQKANKIHDGKYKYHEEHFTNIHRKTIITCPLHGDFEQIPVNHVWSKQGCPKCAEERKIRRYKHTKEEIVEMCKQTHGDKYVYDDIVFQGIKKKILNIKCPKHGYFNQIAYDHIRGFGCEKCKFENQTMEKDEFIRRASKIHNNFYIYEKEKIKYINNNVKIQISCPNHGVFWQRPANHLLGIGCPFCQTSKLEKEISLFLEKNGIEFIQKFHSDWLGRLELDFYLPKYNIGIECQGIQHFEKVKYFDSDDSLKNRLERDTRKKKLCEKNGVKLLYYSNLGIEYPYQVFEDKTKLLNEIRGANN